MTNPYQENLDRIKEEEGFNDPVSVNQYEKNVYELNADRLRTQANKKKEVMSYENTSWGQTISQALGNLPGDVAPYLKDYVEGIGFAISHPAITAKSIAKLGTGLVKSVIEDPTGKWNKQEDKDLQAWMAVEDQLFKTFGTEKAFKQFVAEQPMEAIVSLAELVIPAAKIGKLKKIEKAAGMVDPVNLTMASLDKAKSFILSKDVTTGLYRRALKLGDNLSFKRKERILKMAQNNKLNIDFKNVDKLESQIREIDNIKESTKTIVGMFDPSTKIPVTDMFKKLDALETSLLKVSSEGSKIRKPIEDFKKHIIEANEILGRKDLSLTEQDAYKRRFGKELDKFYDKVVSTTETMPLKKEIVAEVTNTLKQVIEEAIPELKVASFPKLSKRILKKQFGVNVSWKQVNELQGDLIELKKVIQDHSNKFDTGKIMDFQVGQKTATGAFAGAMVGTAVAGETGKDIGLYLGGATGLALGTLDSSPTLKMSLANVLNTMKSMGIPVKPSATLIRLGLYEAGDYAKTAYPELEIQGD